MVLKSRYADIKPDPKYKDLVSNFFWSQLDKFRKNVLFVDYDTQRHWTGAQIKSASARLARNLIKHGLKAGDNCVIFYKHCDYIHVVSMGVFFAGGSRCASRESDPEQEHAYLLAVVEPKFVFVSHKLLDEILRLRSAGKHNYTIVIMDDDEDSLDEAAFKKLTRKRTIMTINWPANKGEQDQQQVGDVVVLGLHHDLLSIVTDIASANTPLPVQVDPQQPVFIDFSSGSTGRPKPIGKSHRNCLYISLDVVGNKDLWNWNESSRVAIVHGAIIFQLNQCLTHGFKSIIMSDYKFEMLLDAIRTHRITHLVLGSPVVHNLLLSREVDEALSKPLPASGLDSLVDVIAVGSQIASPSVLSQFMERLPGCSARQAYGVNEASYLCLVPRELALHQRNLDERIVGCAMPNVELKLVSREKDRANEEITEFDQIGELYVRSPTVSGGYYGDQFRQQTNEVFLADGFYRTNDMCSIGSDGMLRVYGRFSQVLCLGEGYKVLPNEIERVIIEHPLVKEAAVVGVPNPKLPACQAARAYVVPRDGVEIDYADDALLDELLAVLESNSNGSNADGGNNCDNRKSALQSRTISRRSIFEFVAGRVAKHKYLIGGIKFVTELPKLTAGKINKQSLKAADGY